jgi:hypothetical protein
MPRFYDISKSSYLREMVKEAKRPNLSTMNARGAMKAVANMNL